MHNNDNTASLVTRWSVLFSVSWCINVVSLIRQINLVFIRRNISPNKVNTLVSTQLIIMFLNIILQILSQTADLRLSDANAITIDILDDVNF